MEIFFYYIILRIIIKILERLILKYIIIGNVV